MGAKLITCVTFLLPFTLFGQGVDLQFETLFQGKSLAVSDDHSGAVAGAELRIMALRYYVSSIKLLRGQEVVFTESASFHLLDASEAKTMHLPLDPPVGLKWDRLQFTLGIDSLTSSAGVYGGDLDPTKGMYWTWRSGYIHFKLEGQAKACPARNNEFQFHLGGYQWPFNSVQTITLQVADTDAPVVQLKLDDLFAATDLSQHYKIMSPTTEAKEMARLVASLFAIKPITP